MEIINYDTILDWFKKAVSEKQPINPDTWLESASKLNILMEDLDDDLVNNECILAIKRAEYINAGESVAKAERLTEALPEWKTYKQLKAKKERAIEHIKIAKRRASTPFTNI